MVGDLEMAKAEATILDRVARMPNCTRAGWAPKFPSLELGMPAEFYHADPSPLPSLSQSCAHTLVSKSPLHAWLGHPRFGGASRDATRSMDRGTLVHRLLLHAGAQVIILNADDWRTKAAREQRDAGTAAGFIVCLQKEHDAAVDAVKHFAHQLVDFGIKLDGVSEAVVFWTETADDGTEVPCRLMTDHWSPTQGRIFDVKNARTANPQKLDRYMFEFGCDIQAAAYLSAFTKLYPERAGRLDFWNLFCEFEPPYCLTPVVPASSMLELGERRWRRAINTWARCMKANSWPPYATKPVYIDAPAWALNQEMDEYENV